MEKQEFNFKKELAKEKRIMKALLRQGKTMEEIKKYIFKVMYEQEYNPEVQLIENKKNIDALLYGDPQQDEITQRKVGLIKRRV